MFQRNWLVISLALLAVAIKIFSLFPGAVEKYYSNGLYPMVSQLQRVLLGWIPFSIGDLLYGAAAFYLIMSIIRFGWSVSKKPRNKSEIRSAIKRTLTVVLVIYVWFNISWGLNYNRIGILKQLGLEQVKFSPEELSQMMERLVQQINAAYPEALKYRGELHRKRNLFRGADDAYRNLSKNMPRFTYGHAAVKPSIYSYLGNYLGFTGYYNPFTGEAQVNTTVPVFILPFTTCHEIGHQLGYAKEREANLAGYLSARSSTNPAFLYSVYFEMYAYSRRYMYASDSTELKRLDSMLLPGVKQDYRNLRAFYERHANPVEVLVDKLYSRYLQANEQPAGRVSYNEVVLLLMSVYREYGKV